MSLEQLRVLVVDDEEAMREVLRERLGGWGMEVELATDVAEALHRVSAAAVDVVISDVILPDATGLDLLRELRSTHRELPVVLITAHGSVDVAVEAMKEGAQDFLTKPIDYDKLRSILSESRRHLRQRASRREIASELGREGTRFGELVGTSPAMREVYDLIREAAPTDAPVLITGESGTGKELTARTLHSFSGRRQGPFVAVNAAAIPRELMESEIFGHEKGAFTGASTSRQGCFELAHGGTLLLDEIAEMPEELQPKLLRVLEDGRVRRLGGDRESSFDVRVVAATNRDPHEALASGRLRRDLFYRLDVFQIPLPPLRRRRSDIPLLAQTFVEHFNAKHGTAVEGLAEEIVDELAAYDWPGNVRELRNVLERGVVLAKEGWISAAHLPPYLRGRATATGDTIEIAVGTPVAEAERQLILRTLEQTGNNKAEAARRLGVDVKTVRNKLKAYGIDQ